MRETEMPPARFAEAALRELPREKVEQIAAQILKRGLTALSRYAPEADAERLRPTWGALLAERVDSSLPSGLRKTAGRAGGGGEVAWVARAVLREYLRVRARVRRRLGEAADALKHRAAPGLPRRAGRQGARRHAGGARRAFIAGAAEREAAAKEACFRR